VGRLGRIYDKRNDAIHKFFLTPLRYSDLTPILRRYELVFQTLYKTVYDLEAEQVRLGCGMTHPSSKRKDRDKEMLVMVMEKIGESEE
jgi:hypothetical protein